MMKICNVEIQVSLFSLPACLYSRLYSVVLAGYSSAAQHWNFLTHRNHCSASRPQFPDANHQPLPVLIHLSFYSTAGPGFAIFYAQLVDGSTTQSDSIASKFEYRLVVGDLRSRERRSTSRVSGDRVAKLTSPSSRGRLDSSLHTRSILYFRDPWLLTNIPLHSHTLTENE